MAFSRLPRSAEGHGTSSREEAARALANLAGNDENKLAIAANGGIMPLIMLLRDSHPPAREEAARALVTLAVDAATKVAIAQAGGVMPLITCLSPRRAYYV